MSFPSRAAAKRAGLALRRRVKSKGWKVRVWENLGWHFSLVNGPVSLHEDRYLLSRPTYMVLIDNRLKDPIGGLGHWTETGGSRKYDPNNAIRAGVDYMARVIKHDNEIFEAAMMARPK